MKKWIILALLGYGAFTWYQNDAVPKGGYGEPHDELIMYSLTTCGHCKNKARQLTKERIAFTEYFVEKDNQRRHELHEKLRQSGYEAGSYGMPIFDVHGRMLPNNPDIRKIMAILDGA